MAVTDWDTFFDVLAKSGMLDGEKLTKARASTQQLSDPSAIARRLVNEGLLSRWQASQILEGRDVQHLGKYKLLDELEATATSRVYLAEHTGMDRRVALKTLPRRPTTEGGEASQFQQNLAAVSSLNHPNVNQIYDVDQADGNYYLIMEYSEGRTLEQVVQDEGPLDFMAAARYIHQAALGLSHAHQQGIVHRDICPANLLATKLGPVKILDMGLKRLSGDGASSSAEILSLQPEMVDYLAPELVNGKDVSDPRVDVYGLGCTFYFLLTGRPPFPEGTTVERLKQHQTAQPPDILQLRPDTPPPLVEMCRWMMAKRPNDRPASAQEVADRSLAWIAEQEKRLAASRSTTPAAAAPLGTRIVPLDEPAVSSVVSLPTADSVTVRDTVPEETTDQPGSEASKKLPLIIGGCVAGVLLMVILSAVLVSLSRDDRQANGGQVAQGSTVTEQPGKTAEPGSESAASKTTQESSPGSFVAASDPSGVTKDLVGYWDFETGFVERLRNVESKHGSGASIINDPDSDPKRGKVLKLDGTAEALVQAGRFRSFPDQFSVMAWVRLNADSGARQWQTIAAAWDPKAAGSEKCFFNLALNQKGHPIARLGTPGSDDPDQFQVEATPGVNSTEGWVHLAFTVRLGDRLRLYRDGKPVRSRPYSASILPHRNTFVFFGNHENGDATSALKGMLDDVRIYQRALLGSEISQVYEKTKGAPPPPASLQVAASRKATLLAHWPLDESSGEAIKPKEGKFQGKFVGKRIKEVKGATAFDGKENAIAIRGFNINEADAVTITAWVKGRANADKADIVCHRSGNANAKKGYGLCLDRGRKLAYEWGSQRAVSTLVVPTDDWAMVAASIGPQQATLYLWTKAKGLMKSSPKKDVKHDKATFKGIAIGRSSKSKSRCFRGFIKDVRIYDSALDEAAIKTLVSETEKNLPDVTLPAPEPSTATPSPPPGKTTPPKTVEPSRETREHEQGFVVLKPTKADGGPVKLDIAEDGSIFAVASSKNREATYQIALDTTKTEPGMNRITAIRLEALGDQRLPGRGPGYGNTGAFSIAEIGAEVAPLGTPVKRQKLKLVSSSEGVSRYAVDGGTRRRWNHRVGRGQAVSATFFVQQPVDCPGGSVLFVTVITGDSRGQLLGRFRLAASTASREKLVVPPKEPKPQENAGRAKR